jgi:outer membrane protein TolC
MKKIRAKSNMHSRLITIILLILSCQLRAQPSDSTFFLSDTLQPFSLETFYQAMIENHPVAKQVDLLGETAKQEVRLAKGNFDPKLEAGWQKKRFNNTDYYSIASGELKFPSLIPLDPKLGIEQNQGEYLNPERYISQDYNYRQIYAGISVPLGRGLITDDRRTALRQAELFTVATEAEQVKQINKLFVDAAKDYWEWFFAFYNYQVYERNVRVARDIFQRIKQNALLGEVAPVDTVQALITWQQRLVDQREAFLQLRNTEFRVSNYLWDSLQNPLALNLRYAPVPEPDPIFDNTQSMQQLLDQALSNHPELQKINIKLRQLELDRNLAREYLKPSFNVSYNLLNAPFSPVENFATPVWDNYKLGLDFSFPLFLRKERAKYTIARLKIANTRYEQRMMQLNIANELKVAFNTLSNNLQILQQQRAMVENYKRLLQAEILNVENGESDLFKLNIQQEKFLQAQSKAIKVHAEVEKQKATLYWAAGIRRLPPTQ